MSMWYEIVLMISELQKYWKTRPPKGFAIIYAIVHRKTFKSYIGQTISSLRKRFGQHRWPSKKAENRMYIGRAIRKHGAKSFYVFVLDLVSNDEKNEAEISTIARFQTLKNGYNLTPGGETFEWTEEMRENARKAALKRLCPEEIEARRASGKRQSASETLEDYEARIALQKKTKADPAWKARHSAIQKKAKAEYFANPKKMAEWDTMIQKKAEQKLEKWKAEALMPPDRPKDRIVGKYYVDEHGTLYNCQACKGQSPILRKVSMETVLKTRARLSKKNV